MKVEVDCKHKCTFTVASLIWNRVDSIGLADVTKPELLRTKVYAHLQMNSGVVHFGVNPDGLSL